MPLLPLVLAAALAPAAPAEALPDPDPSHMSLKEIRAFNKQLGSNMHPQYIRCRRDVDIGTLAKAHTVCRMNKDWARADDQGNRAAKDTVRQALETGWTQSVEPRPDQVPN